MNILIKKHLLTSCFQNVFENLQAPEQNIPYFNVRN